MRLTFGPFILNVDAERTQAYYHSQEPGIGCSCSGCRNYERVAAAFPEKLQDFFRALGIDPQKPAEVYVNCTQADGRLWYGGFYHLRGRLLQGEGGWYTVAEDGTSKTRAWDRESCYLAAENFRVAFTEDAALVAPDFPRPVLQLEIDASLPWLLEEENDNPKME